MAKKTVGKQAKIAALPRGSPRSSGKRGPRIAGIGAALLAGLAAAIAFGSKAKSSAAGTGQVTIPGAIPTGFGTWTVPLDLPVANELTPPAPPVYIPVSEAVPEPVQASIREAYQPPTLSGYRVEAGRYVQGSYPFGDGVSFPVENATQVMALLAKRNDLSAQMAIIYASGQNTNPQSPATLRLFEIDAERRTVLQQLFALGYQETSSGS